MLQSSHDNDLPVLHLVWRGMPVYESKVERRLRNETKAHRERSQEIAPHVQPILSRNGSTSPSPQ